MENKIRQEIDERGLKISFILRKTDLSKSYFYDVMKGKTVPSLIKARKIAETIGVSLEELFPMTHEGKKGL